MYMSGIGVVGVLSRTHIKWRDGRNWVLKPRTYTMCLGSYKREWDGDTDGRGEMLDEGQ